ncbi:RelA/SpoT domain-containing protein [Sphingomonas sp. H39-1-10]|uniref:RelA/SpoT domain-containing protein n=1 Tax=Sphingomonas pollutisoli TaxID=3030829 RepID=UPI0023B93754|nr:RelA/SpoT domain-containing protein [Sphingomonas pollutisoli]MDF0489191.1 RelA/SpoT domain-containing protein [Sphingomonas pollutisoli]
MRNILQTWRRGSPPRRQIAKRWEVGEKRLVNSPEDYPGGSRKRVSRAGEAIRDGRATPDDLAVLDRWRAAHRHVLNSFQALLRNRTRHRDIIVAQRHKRRQTIMGKLRRHPDMKLHRMDDVAGCRLIFQDYEALTAFRSEFQRAKFKHELRNDSGKYDYIINPKADGYRGIHDVYKYDVNSHHGATYKGLQIELQYRTIYQHAWATCVEVVGLITKSNPKFKQGDKRYEQVMVYASEMISRVWESQRGPVPDMGDVELAIAFDELDSQLGLMDMLRELDASDALKGGRNHNIILIFSEDAPMEIKTFRDATQALLTLFDLEEENAGNSKDIVLVRGNRQDVRTAFRNYFSDASDFIYYIEEARSLLYGSPAVADDLYRAAAAISFGPEPD